MAVRHGTYTVEDVGIPWTFDLNAGTFLWEPPGAAQERLLNMDNPRQVRLEGGLVVNEEMLLAQAIQEMIEDGVFEDAEEVMARQGDVMMSPPPGASPVDGSLFASPPAAIPSAARERKPVQGAPSRTPDALISVMCMVIKAQGEIIKSSEPDDQTLALVGIFSQQIEDEYQKWNSQ